MSDERRRLQRLEELVDRLLGRQARVVVRGGGAGGSGFVIKSAESKAALDAILEEGELGYVTGTDKFGYWKLDGETLCISHTE